MLRVANIVNIPHVGVYLQFWFTFLLDEEVIINRKIDINNLNYTLEYPI